MKNYNNHMLEELDKFPRNERKLIPSSVPLNERFFEKVIIFEDKNKCWGWKGAKSHGYPFVHYKGKNHRASRISWKIVKGEIPNDKIICHHCDNPECSNPLHLYLGTDKTNMQDKVNRGRATHGSSVKNSKITETDIPIILGLRKNGLDGVQIGKRFGVSGTTITRILAGTTWKHVKRPLMPLPESQK